MLACKDTCEHWTVQHKARIVAAQAAQKPRRGEFELYVVRFVHTNTKFGGKHMKISPTLTEVKEIAKTGKYDILPVSCEILSDFITPIEAMRILQNVSTHCYLLESAQANEAWGRYTFLGYDPKLEINCIDGHMKLGKLSVETDNPSEYIRQILSEYKSPKFDYLPSFTGGLVGYFSYDYLGYKEKSIRGKARDTEAFKDVDLMLFDKV